MPITALPPAPARTDPPATYVTKADAWVAAMPTFVSDANVLAAGMNSIAAGGAYSIPYTFDTNTADTDPGNGFLRLNNATQNAATVLRLDLLSSAGGDWTSVIDSFDSSGSANKGQIRLVKASDATKWMTFNVTARTSMTGYRNITVANGVGSSASPFVNGDALMLNFQRTGDIGTPATILRRVVSVASDPAPVANVTTTDIYMMTALAAASTLGAPTGSPLDGQPLMFRIKDNGTARALAYNTIFRASSDLGLPSTTVVGKTLYIGFVYNAADTKWDLVAVLNNV